MELGKRKSTRTAALCIIALLLLTSCGQDSKFGQFLNHTFQKTKVEAPTAENGANMLEAFNVAFRLPPPVVLGFFIPNETNESDAEVTRFSAAPKNVQTDFQLSFEPAAFVHISNDLVALVSNGTGEQTSYNCHACQGKMTVHYLKKEENGYTLLGNWEISSGAADFGETSPWTVKDDIDQNPVMYFTRTFGGMGCHYEGVTIVALTPIGPEAIAEFTLAVGYRESEDTTNGPSDFDYAGTFRQLQKGRKFAIDYVGTKSGRAIYVKDQSGKFVAEESEIVEAVGSADC